MANLRLQELVRAAREAKATNTSLAEAITTRKPVEHGGMHGEAVTYNAKQQEFVDVMQKGQSCVLIGAAGTGKTTCTQGAIKALLATDTIPVLQAGDHKHIKSGAPGILTIAYTRRAVNNIKKVLPPDLKANCITAHKLLEYAPLFYEVYDDATQEYKKTMKFEATRNQLNPLPDTIHTIIVEESSMLGTGLYQEIVAALIHKVQWVFIGDIQQLPPVFGPAILGFAMLKLPVIELTQVYRQALESPIIKLAHQILSGIPIPKTDYALWSEHKHLTIHPWKKKIIPDHATLVLAKFFKTAIDNKLYDPEEDTILIPYNKACGTLELNKHIANYLAKLRDVATHEIIGGFNKHYFSVGDKVLYDKEDAEIIAIEPNYTYTGARYQPASKTLDYWGYNSGTETEKETYQDDAEFLLSQVAAEKQEDRVLQASHKLQVKLLDSEREITLDTASDINNLLHAYALTVHKAQGSEWRKVFLAFHHSHATMTSRELLYTAVTRAREELYVICEPETFTKGIRSQRIKGNTLEEKAEHFKGKKDNTTEHHYIF